MVAPLELGAGSRVFLQLMGANTMNRIGGSGGYAVIRVPAGAELTISNGAEEGEATGSLTIDEDLMDAVGMYNYEKLLVANVDNGERFETYAMRGPRGSGVCCLNGAAAHQGKVGDRLIVMAFAQMDEGQAANFSPKVLHF